MFNHFTFGIVERLTGRKPVAILGEFSGTTERTWRNRLKQGWQPSEEDQACLDARTTAKLAEQLIDVGGWSADEANQILAQRPSCKAGTFLPTAEMIYGFSPCFAEYCPETLALAEYFDHDCERLVRAVEAGAVDEVRKVLTSMLDWLQTFCPDESDTSDAAALRAQFEAGTDIGTLLKAATSLHDALVFHVLSCWDLEFCAGYFGDTMQASPLFELVMPRFAPDIHIAPETGHFSRNGRLPRRHLFDTATSRFIDFLSVLVAWRRGRTLPGSLPRIKHFAAWCREDESRVVSWRDETTRLTTKQLTHLWTTALKPDSEGIYPAIPMPMFVCMHLWGPLLVREGRRATQLLDCSVHYHMWWERNRDRLVAKGLRFGEQAWPAFFIAQQSESFASFCASQSSGRSSSPRDCQ
jgi:hypothetical protein